MSGPMAAVPLQPENIQGQRLKRDLTGPNVALMVSANCPPQQQVVLQQWDVFISLH